MKTHRTTREGFILFLAVAMIPLVGVALLLLSGGTRMLAGEERLARREVCLQNLLKSAVVWVGHNRQELAEREVGAVETLDVSEFCLKEAACRITVDCVAETEVRVTIAVVVDAHTRAKESYWAISLLAPDEAPAVIRTVSELAH